MLLATVCSACTKEIVMCLHKQDWHVPSQIAYVGCCNGVACSGCYLPALALILTMSVQGIPCLHCKYTCSARTQQINNLQNGQVNLSAQNHWRKLLSLSIHRPENRIYDGCLSWKVLYRAELKMPQQGLDVLRCLRLPC